MLMWKNAIILDFKSRLSWRLVTSWVITSTPILNFHLSNDGDSWHVLAYQKFEWWNWFFRYWQASKDLQLYFYAFLLHLVWSSCNKICRGYIIKMPTSQPQVITQETPEDKVMDQNVHITKERPHFGRSNRKKTEKYADIIR